MILKNTLRYLSSDVFFFALCMLKMKMMNMVWSGKRSQSGFFHHFVGCKVLNMSLL